MTDAVRNGECNASPRFILITQCLQNDFFLNAECSLCLPEEEVRRLLIGNDWRQLEVRNGCYVLPDGYPKKGPMGRFLQAAIESRLNADDGPILHVVNIRDWHERDANYDAERRFWGAHCEEGSDGARYLSGLDDYLDPEIDGRRSSACEARYLRRGRVRIYHVQSNSVFDFGAGYRTELERCLELLLYGSDAQLDATDSVAGIPELPEKPTCRAPVYVAVIGVYTDVKVGTLLIGLRSQYPIENLAVSDSLTASPSLEGHIGALDFADKVLQVEVIHGLNDLLRFLGGSPAIECASELVGGDRYADFRSYRQDKHQVLADRARMLGDYLALTRKRGDDVYRGIAVANRLLLFFGVSFLALTLIGGIASVLYPILNQGQSLEGGWVTTGVMGALGSIQLLARLFFTKPFNDLYRNLTNLVSLRVILENHSLKTALARFHLTSPETLRHGVNEQKASRQLGVLQEELKILDLLEHQTYGALRELGFVDARFGTPAPADEDAAPAAGKGEPASEQEIASVAGTVAGT